MKRNDHGRPWPFLDCLVVPELETLIHCRIIDWLEIVTEDIMEEIVVDIADIELI